MVHIRTFTMINNPTTTTTNSSAIMYDRPSSLQFSYVPQTSSLTPSTYSTVPLLTPSTPITPNTLKSIEQSILQTLGEDTAEASGFLMESNQYSGNFVPPLPSTTSTNTITLINTWQGGQVSSDGVNAVDEDIETKPDINKAELQEEPQQQQKTVETNSRKRKAPVRKQPTAPKQPAQPKQTKKQTQQKPGFKRQRSAEEDERRRVRRERNKLAAARCRKRRVDHTNKLQEETEGLEAKKRELQNKITELQSQKEELEFVLEAHNCVKKVRSEVLSDLQNLPRSVGGMIDSIGGGKPKRPCSLNVISTAGGVERIISTTTTASGNTNTPSLISISTPSNGISGLGFDSLADCWGVTPADETKNVPVTSNNNDKGCSLVTPVSNPYKKLHDL